MLPTRTIPDWLNLVDYSLLKKYVPTKYGLEFINFIKMVNADSPEENKTPLIHYVMADSYFSAHQEIANLVFRGSAKTSLSEYFVLYIACMGKLPKLGKINAGIFIGANEKACKQFKENLEGRIAESAFLQQLLVETHFTIDEWELTNLEGNKLKIWAMGAQTPFRGKRSVKSRPQVAILDDIIDEKDARSDIIIQRALATATTALRPAMHPTRYKIIWNGTPYNSKDPLYRSIESGAWKSNVYPIAEKFPCSEEEFIGCWEDRFAYTTIARLYDKFEKESNLAGFYAEYMLDIASEESKLIKDTDIKWFSLEEHREKLIGSAIYATTDFATSAKEHADYSTINIWSYANIGAGYAWYWLDGFCERTTMDKSIDKLFEFAKTYKIYQAGVEVSGQQGGFISWILREQRRLGVTFGLAKGKTTNVFQTSDRMGLNPVGDKFQRFTINSVPLLKTSKIHFPLEKRDTPEIQEFLNELSQVTALGFKSLHDDQLDNITMLSEFDLLERSPVKVPVDENKVVKCSNIFTKARTDFNRNTYDVV